jgi:hypothetical protein
MSNLEWTLAVLCALAVCVAGGIAHDYRRFRIVANARIDKLLKQYRDLKEQIDRGRWGR